MKFVAYHKKVYPKKKLKVEFDKRKNKRPAWIKVEGLPKDVNFIEIHLGKKGKEGTRIQFYKTYLPQGLFLPINYTKEEMKIFYDKFSEIYDYELKNSGAQTKGQNILAAKFLIEKVKKYIKKGELLDLGAGTGLITEMFVKEDFSPATLVDYSEGMLSKAKKRQGLKGCKFIKKDLREMELNKKFDLILSFFSFGAPSYYDLNELKKLTEKVKKHLKKNGIFAVLGHLPLSKIEKEFIKLDSGTYNLNTHKKFYTDYFIGRK